MYVVELWYTPHQADGLNDSWEFETLDEARTFAEEKAKEYSAEWTLVCMSYWFEMDGTK